MTGAARLRPSLHPARAAALALAAALLGLGPRVHAAEQATLSNGFTMRCNHHALVDGRMRLYLSAGQDDYVEFAPGEIAGFQKFPDPAQVVPASAAPPHPAPASPLTGADLRQMLARAGAEHNLDVDLLASVVKAESGGNPRAVSHAGAQGLMQLMPGTAADMGVRDRLQPDQNVRGGSTYLDDLLIRYHDNLALALAAYNAGPEAVDRYHGIPPYRETRLYVARVIHEFNRRVQARQAQAKTLALPPAAHLASR